MCIQPLNLETVCDGCGRAATPEHIRERLARLEWCTRFRPIHIQLLLLISAPHIGADFYDAAAESGAEPSLDSLFGTLGIAATTAKTAGSSGRETLLGEFQRRGIFLAPVCECPLGVAEIAGAVERLGPVIAKRVRFSYKPKAIVLLSPELAVLKGQIEAAVQGIRVTDASHAFAWASGGDASAKAELSEALTGALQT